MWYFAGIPILPANRAWFTAVFLFTCLSFTFMLMRMYSRIFLTRVVGWDDGLMIIAMGLSMAYTGTIIDQINLGLGDKVSAENAVQFTFSVYFTILIYTWGQWVIKLSIAASYRRLFPTQRPRMIIKWIFIWLWIYGIVNCITPIFMCTPVARFWDKSVLGTCINYFVLHYVLSSINVCNDFLILVFPIPILLKLKLPVRVRVILIVTFACGLFASIVSMMRFQALVIFASGGPEQGATLDVQISIWSSLEMNVAIMCGSVPAIKPLFSLFIPHLDVLSTGNTGNTSQKHKKGNQPQSWVQLDDRHERMITSEAADGEGESYPRNGVWVQQSIEIKSTAANLDTDSESCLVGSSDRSKNQYRQHAHEVFGN